MIVLKNFGKKLKKKINKLTLFLFGAEIYYLHFYFIFLTVKIII